MANDLTTLNSEADNICSAVQQDSSGPGKMLKFRKGGYFVGDESVSLGTEFLVHARAWVKAWIKFSDSKVVERKLYRVALGERPPERNDLDKLDQVGTDADPWSFQYFVPLENLETGEVLTFVTSSFGGQKAVRDLCDAYGRRVRNGKIGQPIVQLATTTMPSKKYGDVPRPLFEVVGWDDAADAPEAPLAATLPEKPVRPPPTPT